MGIPGLLVALKSVTYPIHISEYRGLTAGVDAYCWLHRGTFSCGTELCTGVATDKYVAFCMKRVHLLRHHGVEPIMVFDGASLPMKGDKHLERRRQRDSARAKGDAALAAGEAGAAAQHFSKAVGVTYEMAFELIKALRRQGVKLVVAPYEADAQLAYLNRSGAVDVVLTEDSDCLPYGCKKVLFKMDNEGHGQEIQLRNLAANTPLSLCNWKNSMFLDLCLLVGCDYITTSVKGLGIATAHKLVHRHRSLDKIIRAVETSKFVVPEGYWDEYRRARLTFRHHIVYDHHTEGTIHLMPLGDTAKEMGSLEFLGPHLPPHVAQGVASGHLLPNNHTPYSVAPTEPPVGRPPSPSQQTMRPEDGSATSRTKSVAEAATSNGTDWERRTETASSLPSGTLEKTIETRGEHPLVTHTRFNRARASSAQPVLSGIVIDRPFSAKRPALAEFQFPPHDRTSQISQGWDTTTNDNNNNNTWGLDDPQSPYGGPESPRHRYRRKLVVTPSSSGGMETRPTIGLDLARIREAGAPDPTRDIPTALPFPRDPWSRGFLGTPTSCSTVGKPLLPLSLSLREGDKNGLVDDWAAQGWREGDSTSPAGMHEWGSACPPVGDGGWGEPGPDAHQPVWGEGGGEEESAETCEESGDARQAVGDVRQSAKGGDKASLFGWTCYAPSAAEKPPLGRTSERERLDFGGRDASAFHEGGGQQGVNALALTEPPDANRAKFVPTSAQHFHSTQVSRDLETLQRRKRRLCPAGDGAPDPSPTLDWLEVTHSWQKEVEDRQGVRQNDGEAPRPLEENIAGASNASAGGLWMVQANSPAKSDCSDTLRGGGGQGGAIASKGLSLFSKGVAPQHASTPTVTLPLAGSPVRQDSTKLLTQTGERNILGNEASARGFAASSRRWTVPSHVPSTRPMELPLLRHLGGAEDHSWRGRIGGTGASQPLPKRTRGTQFWDARLMR